MGIKEQMKKPELNFPEIKKTKIIDYVEKVPKKRQYKEEVPTVFKSHMSFENKTIKELKNIEKRMRVFDNECLTVSENRNLLESYVLNGQNIFSETGKYYNFMKIHERDEFMNKILNADDFLCNDNFDQKAQVYAEKLSVLTSLGDLYIKRYIEWKKRPIVLEKF